MKGSDYGQPALDQAEAVRQGEQLDVARLEAYLLDHLSAARRPLQVDQFPSGYSNLTYLLRLGEQELVLRRPPFGANIHSAHDMGREYKVLSGLWSVYPRVPRPLLYCTDESVIGAPFYVMQRVSGVILRAGKQREQRFPPEIFRRLSINFIHNLAEIHALDIHAAGLADLGRPAGYGARQISGWSKRYRAAQTNEIPGVEAAIDWLPNHLPPEPAPALIHNDYKYDNVILSAEEPTVIRAVLDWEMCTVGDPLMDLGTTLGYWIEPEDPPALQAMFGITTAPGNLNRRQLVEEYGVASGHPVDHLLFYYVYGLFKIAGIIQQIYHRYRQGHTQDERFARLLPVVQAYGTMITEALERGHL
jgi:aminoglycoside phosphotransferase (APT) family kinase protein